MSVNIMLSGFFLVALVVVVQGQYEDVRCKCVCPSVQLPNTTESSRKVFVHTFKEPGRCKCENVVDEALREQYENFCARCECQWQRRNTTTIKGIVILVIVVIGILVLYMLFLLCLDPLLSRKHGATYTSLHLETAIVEPARVVVILIICVVSLLFLYMLFLLCLDPLMSRRPKSYLEQHNEEDTQSVTTDRVVEDGATTRQRPGTLVSRVKHEVNRVKGEQQKWKGTVQEQRRNIYDRHTMLN